MGTWQQIIMELAVNLIASSIVYAVGYKNPAIILFALGLLLIALVAIFSRKPKPLAVDDNRTGGDVSSNSSTTNQDSFKQEFNPTFNPTFSPSITINPSSNPPPSPTPISVRAIPRREESKYNLVFL
jgi:hypothetical protein